MCPPLKKEKPLQITDQGSQNPVETDKHTYTSQKEKPQQNKRTTPKQPKSLCMQCANPTQTWIKEM